MQWLVSGVGMAWTVVQWALALVIGVGGVVMCAGPREVGNELRREGQRAGVMPKRVVKFTTVEEVLPVAGVKTQTTKAALVLTGTLTLQNQRTPANGPTGPGPTVVASVSYPPGEAFVARIFQDPSTGQWGFFAGSGQWQWGFDMPELAENEHAYAVGLNGFQEPGNLLPPSHYSIVKTADASMSADFSLSGGGADLWRERTHSPAPGRDASPVYSNETKATDSWQNTEHPYSYSATCGVITLSGTQQWNETYGWVPDWSPDADMHFRVMQYNGVEGTDYALIDARLAGEKVDFSHRHKTLGVFTLLGSSGRLTLHCDSTGGASSGYYTWDVWHGLPYIIDFRNVYVRNRQGTAVDGVRLAGPFQASPRVPASLTWSTTP